jgi:hypothetical protein
MNRSLKLRRIFAISSLFLPLIVLGLKITSIYVYVLMGLLFAINIMFLFLYKPEKSKLILFSCFVALTIIMYFIKI